MASQPTMVAAARESRANAREDMAILTSGAREKVDSTLASVQGVGQQMLHPFDKKAREEAQAKAEEMKKKATDKRDEIRSVAQQQAQQERLAARSQVARQIAGGAGGIRYTRMDSTPQHQSIHPPVEEPDKVPPSVDQGSLGSHLNASSPSTKQQSGSLGDAASTQENPHLEHAQVDSHLPDQSHLDQNHEFRGLEHVPTEASPVDSAPQTINCMSGLHAANDKDAVEGGSPLYESNKPADLDFYPAPRKSEYSEEGSCGERVLGHQKRQQTDATLAQASHSEGGREPIPSNSLPAARVPDAESRTIEREREQPQPQPQV